MNEEKMNCWEYMSCGRGPGGSNVSGLGICPATMDESSDNINKGKSGGRFCWSIAGTRCDGEVEGTFAKKLENCLKCKFYLYVEQQEGRHLVLLRNDICYVAK